MGYHVIEALSQLEMILIECSGYVDRDPVLRRHLLEGWALAIADPRPEAEPSSGSSQLEDRFADLLRTFTRCLDRAAIDGTLPPRADPNIEARWIWNQVVGSLVTTYARNRIDQSESSETARIDTARRIIVALTIPHHGDRPEREPNRFLRE